MLVYPIMHTSSRNTYCLSSFYRVKLRVVKGIVLRITSNDQREGTIAPRSMT